MLVSGFVLSLLYFPPVFAAEIPAIKDIGNKLAKLIICVSRVSFGWKKFGPSKQTRQKVCFWDKLVGRGGISEDQKVFYYY